MPAVRCQICQFIAPSNKGYCPKCGKVYQEPLEVIPLDRVGRSGRLKSQGLLGNFLGKKPEQTHLEHEKPDLRVKVAWLIEQNARLEKRVSSLEQSLAQTSLSALKEQKQTLLNQESLKTLQFDLTESESESIVTHEERPQSEVIPDVIAENIKVLIEDEVKSGMETLVESQVEKLDTPLVGLTENISVNIPTLQDEGSLWLKALQPTGIETHATREPEKIRKAVSLEEDIGLKWFSRIGIVALVLGIGLLIRIAFVNNWIGYFPRIALGVGFGMAMTAAGHYVTRWEKYIHWGRTLIGGGFAVMYFVLYSAYHVEEYRKAIGISQATDMLLLSIVVLGAIAMALLHNSKVIVSGAFFLGYTTAALTGYFDTSTLIYGMILSAGLAVLVGIKKWEELGLIGLNIAYLFFGICFHAASMPMITASLILFLHFAIYIPLSLKLKQAEDPNKIPLAISAMNLLWFFVYGIDIGYSYLSTDALQLTTNAIILGLFLGLFSWHTFQFNQEAQPIGSEHSRNLAVLQAVFLLLLSHYLVDQFLPGFGGLSAFVLTGCYFGLSRLARFKVKTFLSQTYLYLGLAALTAAIPLQFSGEIITLIWVIESIILTILSYKLRLKALRHSHYAIDGLTAGKVLLLDLVYAGFQHTAFDVWQILVISATLGAYYVLGFYLHHHPDLLDSYEAPLPGIYTFAATLGLLLLMAFCLPTSLLSICWVGLALALIFLAIQWKFRALLYAGYFAGILATGKYLVLDLGMHLLISNGSTLDFETLHSVNSLGTLAIIWTLAFYLRHNQHRLDQPEPQLPAIFVWSAAMGSLMVSFQFLEGHVITLFWTGLLGIMIALMLKDIGFEALRRASYAVSMAISFKALGYDARGFGIPDGQEMLHIPTFVILVIGFYLLSIMLEKSYPQNQDLISESEDKLPGFYSWIGTFIMAVFVLFQLSSYWVSIGWAIAALTLLLPGFIWNRKAFRIQGMALLALAIAKVFLLDLASLDPLAKTLSFIVLGLILLGVAFVYSRYREKLSEIF